MFTPLLLPSFQFNVRGEVTICLVSLKNNLSMLFNRDAWHQGSGVQMSPLSDIHATSLSNHFWRETERGRENKKNIAF